MRFPRQEYWSRLPFLSPGESSLPRDGTRVSPLSPALAGGFFTTQSPGKPQTISSVQSLSRSLRPQGLQHTRPPYPSPNPSLRKLMSIEWVMPSSHLILCHPHLLPPSIFPSIRVFSYESILRIRWPKYWSFSFSIRPSNEHPGLISFRMDWFDLLAV